MNICVSCFLLFFSLKQYCPLIHNTPHTATLVTGEKTELIVLDKEACLKILPAEANRELEVILEHIRLLSALPLCFLPFVCLN